jgi:flagellar motor protein MotB
MNSPGKGAPAPVAAADDRDARIAALEAELAAERAKPPKIVEKVVKIPLLALRADALFDSGKAELCPNAVKALENAAHALKTFGGNIKVVRVEGHADNQPISTKQFPDNQALSEARALAVARFLAEHSGLPRTKCTVAGHGDAQPITENDTAEGRSRNRRVEVTIEQADQ